MYKRILVAYDGSAAGQKAILDTNQLCQSSDPELFLIAVMPPASAFIGGEGFVYDAEAEQEERKQFQNVLEEGLRRLGEAGHKAQGELVVGDAVDEVSRHAAKIGADLIVVGHTHRTSWAARWWAGSVSKALIEHAPCSVLVVITR
jgi:nucleotide-binding universal stress UspA family protein